jgi:hypothetical protein
MSTNTPVVELRNSPPRGREARTQSIATRFTRAEEQALLERAEANGQNLREWARDVLLRANALERKSEMEMHVFTELVGIQLLLMGALQPLLSGDRLTPDQVANLFRQAQTNKAAKAQELLARRSQKQEK